MNDLKLKQYMPIKVSAHVNQIYMNHSSFYEQDHQTESFFLKYLNIYFSQLNSVLTFEE